MSTVKICALIFQDQGLEGDIFMRERVGFQIVLSEFSTYFLDMYIKELAGLL